MRQIDRITIINFNDIPFISTVNTENGIIDIGKLAEFRKHPKLANLMPNEKHHVSFAWTMLAPYQELPAHKHPIDSMIIICSGDGNYFGEFDHDLKPGDVVYVKSNALHGFRAGSNDLKCLSIQFEKFGLYSHKNKELVEFGQQSSYYKLLKICDSKTKLFANLCNEIHQDTIKLGQPYINHLFGQISRWSTVFQNILYIRQSLVSVPELESIFMDHLIEEFGHNKLLESYNYQWCPELEAYCSWFSNQMMSLCDYRKLILVNMVLERAGDVFSSYFKKYDAYDKKTKEYVDIHNDADEKHSLLGAEYLLTYCNQNFNLAKETCEQAWCIFIKLFKCIRANSLKKVDPN